MPGRWYSIGEGVRAHDSALSAGCDHRWGIVGDADANRAFLSGPQSVIASRPEVAAVLHTHIRNSGSLGLGDSGRHRKNPDERAQRRVAVYQRPGRTFIDHMRLTEWPGTPSSEPSEISRQQCDTVRRHAELIGSRQRVRGDFSIIRG